MTDALLSIECIVMPILFGVLVLWITEALLIVAARALWRASRKLTMNWQILQIPKYGFWRPISMVGAFFVICSHVKCKLARRVNNWNESIRKRG